MEDPILIFAGIVGCLFFVAGAYWIFRKLLCPGEVDEDVLRRFDVERDGRSRSKGRGRGRSASRGRGRGGWSRSRSRGPLREIQVQSLDGNKIVARVENKFVHCDSKADAESKARNMGGGLAPRRHLPHQPGEYYHFHVGNHDYVMQDNGILANFHFTYGNQIFKHPKWETEEDR